MNVAPLWPKCSLKCWSLPFNQIPTLTGGDFLFSKHTYITLMTLQSPPFLPTLKSSLAQALCEDEIIAVGLPFMRVGEGIVENTEKLFCLGLKNNTHSLDPENSKNWLWHLVRLDFHYEIHLPLLDKLFETTSTQHAVLWLTPTYNIAQPVEAEIPPIGLIHRPDSSHHAIEIHQDMTNHLNNLPLLPLSAITHTS